MFKNLHKIRKNLGISAEQMCEILGLKTKAAYYKKEKGSVRFFLSDAKKISEFFQMNIEEIFFESEVLKKGGNLETDI